MAKSDPQRKDVWDILSVVAGFLASVLVPTAIGLVGLLYSNAIKEREILIKEREADLKDREFAREWVELSLDVLRDPAISNKDILRSWAVRAVNYYVDPAIRMSSDLQQSLIAGETRLPQPETDASRTPTCSRDNAIETRESAISWEGGVALVISSCAFRLPGEVRYNYVLIAKNLLPEPFPMLYIPGMMTLRSINPHREVWTTRIDDHAPVVETVEVSFAANNVELVEIVVPGET